MIKTCVADNIPTIHFGIKQYFKSHNKIKIVSNVNNFESLSNALLLHSIDVLILDLELCDFKGLPDLKGIIKDFPLIKVLVYSNLNEQLFAASALKAGASGFLKKSASLDAIEKAIEVMVNGGIVVSDELREVIERNRSKRNTPEYFRKLSGRESEVLRLLCIGKKNHEVSTILNINDKTTSTYKIRIYKKLGVTNLVDLVAISKTLNII
jgi:two-component system response regulator FimZ (fimbrial Z protein)